MDLTERIRSVLDAAGRLGMQAGGIGEDDNLYARGLSSHASVSVMIALEDEFEVEFPDELLNKETFSTIGNIRAALERLGVEA